MASLISSRSIVILHQEHTSRLGSRSDTALLHQRSVSLLHQTVQAIPVREDGRPGHDLKFNAVVRDIHADGIDLECGSRDAGHGLLVLGIPGQDGTPAHVGIEVAEEAAISSTRTVLRGLFGGLGHELLQPDNLIPQYDFGTGTFTLGLPQEVLAQWEEIGVLHVVHVDTLELCPRCLGLPTFRKGCRSCGSAQVATVAGGYRCRDCRWIDTDLAYVVQCPHCEISMPDHAAFALALKGYHANRLDLATAVR
jgi:Zn finger protein HypA/HybF involved in hydrogenase expression